MIGKSPNEVRRQSAPSDRPAAGGRSGLAAAAPGSRLQYGLFTLHQLRDPMPSFQYTARDAKGDLKTGSLEAANRDEVMTQLRRQRMNVVKVEQAEGAKKNRRGRSRCATS